MPLRSLLVRLLFIYFPKWPWIIIGLATVVKFFVPEMADLPNIIINFASIFLFAKIATIIHESGHLLAAYLTGGTPRRMILGTGHEIFRSEWNGMKIILNSVPIGGQALATFTDLPYIRWRLALYLIGGVLLNVAAAFIFYLLFGYDITLYSGIHFASIFIFVNALGVINLLPFYTTYYGFSMPTDGLGLLLLLVNRDQKNVQNLKYSEEYVQAFESYETRNYDQAYALYETLHERVPQEITALSMMAIIRIKQAKPDEALIHLTKIEEMIKVKEFRRARGLIYNNCAWAYLLKNDIGTASTYANLALKEMRKNKMIGGTYGAILIEKGEADIGMQWVLLSVDFKHANDSTLTASVYMMLGEHLKKNFKSRDKHFKYVKENEDKLEMDSWLLWRRCLERTGLAEASYSAEKKVLDQDFLDSQN